HLRRGRNNDRCWTINSSRPQSAKWDVARLYYQRHPAEFYRPDSYLIRTGAQFAAGGKPPPGSAQGQRAAPGNRSQEGGIYIKQGRCKAFDRLSNTCVNMRRRSNETEGISKNSYYPPGGVRCDRQPGTNRQGTGRHASAGHQRQETGYGVVAQIPW